MNNKYKQGRTSLSSLAPTKKNTFLLHSYREAGVGRMERKKTKGSQTNWLPKRR